MLQSLILLIQTVHWAAFTAITRRRFCGNRRHGAELRDSLRPMTGAQVFIMGCGKLTEKFRDAMPVCFNENGKEVKRFKNIEIPDEIRKLLRRGFEFSVPVTGAIPFKIMVEEGVLPKVWSDARTRRNRKVNPAEVPEPAVLQAALTQAETEGQPVAEIAEAAAQGAKKRENSAFSE